MLRPARSLIFDPGLDKGTLPRSKLFTFVFIRHPFERLFSAYTDKFIVNENYEFNSIDTSFFFKDNKYTFLNFLSHFDSLVNIIIMYM